MTSKELTNNSKETTSENKTFVCPVVEFEGELALELSDDLLEQLNWKAGDNLVWERIMDGRYSLKLVRS